MSNFFRKDLNLGRRWLHRLMVVVFFAWFFYCLFSVCKSAIFEFWIRPIYKVETTFATRIPSEVKLVREFTNPWERIQRESYWVNLFLFWVYWEDKYGSLVEKADDDFEDMILNKTYCSTELYNQINEVIKKTGTSKIYIDGNSKLVSIATASNYLKANNIQCFITDSFDGQIHFLSAYKDFQENYYFYTKTSFSNFLTIVGIITWIITITIGLTIPFGIILLIYYKIILFIIYWKRK